MIASDSRHASINAHLERSTEFWGVPDPSSDEFCSQQVLAQLVTVAPSREYRKGERIFRQGDVSDGFFVMLRGRVKLAVPGGTTGERVLAFCGEGKHHRSEAVSLVDGTQVMMVPHEQFHIIAREIPSLALEMSRVQSKRVQTLEENLERLQLPVQARLAYTLLGLTQRFGQELAEGITELRLEFHQDEFASLAGTTRVRATQALSAWRSMGLVQGTRGAYHVNVPGLQALVELLEAEQVK